jgi:hypothetical protein
MHILAAAATSASAPKRSAQQSFEKFVLRQGRRTLSYFKLQVPAILANGHQSRSWRERLSQTHWHAKIAGGRLETSGRPRSPTDRSDPAKLFQADNPPVMFRRANCDDDLKTGFCIG